VKPQNSRPLAGAAAAELINDKISISHPTDTFWQDQTTKRAQLAPHHRAELRRSCISDKVIDGRRYQSVLRTGTDNRHMQMLKNNRLSKSVWDDVQRYPGVLMPQWTVSGERVAGLYKPERPRSDPMGKVRKYEAPQGLPPVLDVHPFNTSRVADPAVPLLVTEGIKKADALTSAGACVIALSGVFNWRSTYGTLGDWENVWLRGRAVTVVFDSDAATIPNVLRAMRRLGRWLKHRGAKVSYCIPPSPLGAGVKVGADDFLAGGGTLQQLLDSSRPSLAQWEPGPDTSLTDSVLAERVVQDVMVDEFRYVHGIGWLEFEGRRWVETGEERVIECVRTYTRELLVEATESGAGAPRLNELAKLQYAGRIKAVAGLVRGIRDVQANVDDFDADPWLLNVGNGVLDLRTLELAPHDPGFLMRHGTEVHYVEDAAHEDWRTALEAVPDDETRRYLQMYFGTGATGLCPKEDVTLFLQGGGANGKSTILNAIQAPLGSYARGLLATVLGGQRDQHPTELMDLWGCRLAFMEETGDGHRLDTTKLKRIVGTGTITARRMYKDSVSFNPTHTLAVTTNHRPLVTDTDHGTWRRLALVPFPHTYGPGDGDRTADGNLRSRLGEGREQQEAVLAWLVRGAHNWWLADCQLPPLPDIVVHATQAWREEGDPLFAFIESRLTACPHGFAFLQEMLENFNDSLDKPHNPWGMVTFAQRLEGHPALKALGAVRGKHSRTRNSGFKGVAFA